jgi:hypothetical protein
MIALLMLDLSCLHLYSLPTTLKKLEEFQYLLQKLFSLEGTSTLYINISLYMNYGVYFTVVNYLVYRSR